MVVCLVADYKVVSYQDAKLLKRATNLEFTTASAIKYTTCYTLAVFVYYILLSRFISAVIVILLFTGIGLCVGVFKIF